MKSVESWAARAPYALLLGTVAALFTACATATPGDEVSGEKTGDAVSASHAFPPGPPNPGPPLSGPPLSGPPISGPPISGPPISGPPLGVILSVDKRCLDALPGELANGAPLFLTDHHGCSPTWALLPSGEILGPGHMCLDAAWGHITDGTAVRMWECNGTDSQQWRLTHEGTIVGPGGKCLSSRFSGSPDESALELECCDGAPNQQWYFQPA